MKTILFDQSSSCIGFTVLENNDLIEHGNLVPPRLPPPPKEKAYRKLHSKINMVKRLLEFWNDVRDLLKEFDPDEVVFERIHYHGLKSSESIEPLAFAGFIIMAAAVEWGVPFYTVRPQSWKAAVGAIGNKANIKQDVARKACYFWDLDPDCIKSNDHSDSLGIAAYWTRFADDHRRGIA